MISITQVECHDRTGEHLYEARLLQEFGQNDGYLNAQKIAELWGMAKKFDTLFSDYTEGKIEPFLAVLMNPRSVWFEIYRLGEQPGPVGVAYISSVIPFYDAKAHFAVWDSVGSGREPIFWSLMDWVFTRYSLHRMSVEVPPYQHGVIRFVRRLGFIEEGERREAVLSKGKWSSLLEFGLLKSDFEVIFAEYLDNLEAVGV